MSKEYGEVTALLDGIAIALDESRRDLRTVTQRVQNGISDGRDGIINRLDEKVSNQSTTIKRLSEQREELTRERDHYRASADKLAFENLSLKRELDEERQRFGRDKREFQQNLKYAENQLNELRHLEGSIVIDTSDLPPGHYRLVRDDV